MAAKLGELAKDAKLTGSTTRKAYYLQAWSKLRLNTTPQKWSSIGPDNFYTCGMQAHYVSEPCTRLQSFAYKNIHKNR